MSYRAAIYRHPVTGDETVMTGPEHAHLSCEELIEVVVREAHNADLFGERWPQVPEEEFRRRLYIGEWEEA